ncbi:hypothetical protein J6590_086822 [Homalodisca vitripennis]|nr:hypothetical protein J6590_086822 [Homalodisca vitripennis]
MKTRSERQSPQSALRLSEWREIPAQESTVVGEDLFGRNGTLREVSHRVHCQSSVYLSGVSYQHRSLHLFTGVYSCRRGFVWKEWYAEGSLARSPLSELGLSEWRELPAQESTVVGEDLFGRNGTLREVSHGVHCQSSVYLSGVSYQHRSLQLRGFVWKEWYAEGSLAQSPLSELGLSEWRELPAQKSTVVGEDLFGRNGTLREVSHGVHCQSSVYLSGVSYTTESKHSQTPVNNCVLMLKFPKVFFLRLKKQ